MNTFLVVVITLALQGNPLIHEPLIYPTPYESKELCEEARQNPGLQLKTWLYKEVKKYNEIPGWSVVPSLTASACLTAEEIKELKNAP